MKPLCCNNLCQAAVLKELAWTAHSKTACSRRNEVFGQIQSDLGITTLYSRKWLEIFIQGSSKEQKQS